MINVELSVILELKITDNSTLIMRRGRSAKIDIVQGSQRPLSMPIPRRWSIRRRNWNGLRVIPTMRRPVGGMGGDVADA